MRFKCRYALCVFFFRWSSSLAAAAMLCIARLCSLFASRAGGRLIYICTGEQHACCFMFGFFPVFLFNVLYVVCCMWFFFRVAHTYKKLVRAARNSWYIYKPFSITSTRRPQTEMHRARLVLVHREHRNRSHTISEASPRAAAAVAAAVIAAWTERTHLSPSQPFVCLAQGYTWVQRAHPSVSGPVSVSARCAAHSLQCPPRVLTTARIASLYLVRGGRIVCMECISWCCVWMLFVRKAIWVCTYVYHLAHCTRACDCDFDENKMSVFFCCSCI